MACTGAGAASDKKGRREATIINDAADFDACEAWAKAAEEGLTLIETVSQTGFQYVYQWNSGGVKGKESDAQQPPKVMGKAPRVFQLQPQKGVSMGYYRSAEGAA